MIPLSHATHARLARLFLGEAREEAQRILTHECAETLHVPQELLDPVGLERIRFAALRISGGSLPALSAAVSVAQSDWRDLLARAGFADDAAAHHLWQPERAVCDECGSLFLAQASRMVALCPECAHWLYGYENCAHEFADGRCARCHWDGSVSEYVRDVMARTR